MMDAYRSTNALLAKTNALPAAQAKLKAIQATGASTQVCSPPFFLDTPPSPSTSLVLAHPPLTRTGLGTARQDHTHDGGSGLSRARGDLLREHAEDALKETVIGIVQPPCLVAR